ncbi:MAG: hypothetical protein LBL99_04750, partial [Holosporaceae bacterium]|nr:hypothetical protein [Holosporaceae bacterium]
MIGVVCGDGDYPRLVARACVEKKLDFCLVFINGFSAAESFNVILKPYLNGIPPRPDPLPQGERERNARAKSLLSSSLTYKAEDPVEIIRFSGSLLRYARNEDEYK